MEDKKIVDKVLEFASLIKYNGEKRDFIEKAIKKFLIDPKDDFSIEDEIKKIFKDSGFLDKKEVKRTLSNFFTIDEAFEMYDYILTIDAGIEDLLFYLIEKYTRYDHNLKKEIGVTVTDLIKFSTTLENIYNYDLIAGNYNLNPNIFNSMEEAYYPYNLQYPDEKGKEVSRMASFITKDALLIFLKKGLKEMDMENIVKNIDFLLGTLSFSREDIIKDPKIRFQEKPLFRIDKENYILINEVHLFFGLPYRLDSLLNNYSWYTDKKGKNFERVAFKVLGEINGNKRIGGEFFSKVNYGSYESDGLINFKDTSWFVELKGRIPRSDSFKGDLKSVSKDIEKGVEEAEVQALRAIKEAEKKGKLGVREVRQNKGILIITEGMYPNLNQNTVMDFKRKDENYPRYIISFLTLMEILRQHDIYYLKQFLEWRSDPEMPIYCFSELDYWDYFTSMQSGLDKKEGYELSKKNHNKIIFNGKRFNAPKFIKNLDK